RLANDEVGSSWDGVAGMGASRFEEAFNTRVHPALQGLFGVEVSLHRGHLFTEPFTARRNDREHSALGAEYGLEITVLMRDFLLPVASVVIDGDEVQPRTGDRICEGDEIFEIQPPDKSK